jgi:hypothetical protein
MSKSETHPPLLLGMVGATGLLIGSLAARSDGSFWTVVAVVGYALAGVTLAVGLSRFVSRRLARLIRHGPDAPEQPEFE